jgi:hypothetical protein
MGIHPNNPNVLIVGGIDLHRSDDGGVNWTPISLWVKDKCGKGYAHADQHNIQFRPGSPNEVAFANDGGVDYSTNAGLAGTANPTFIFKSTTYNVTQFFACATKN